MSLEDVMGLKNCLGITVKAGQEVVLCFCLDSFLLFCEIIVTILNK